ncbi:hypothetical protein GGI18_000400 [Coemansia linderi]|uniref:Uncharacterized protein n=1 Tax=Coemansia linderi TaxID=2663919 RepID=A0ACC1KMZ2_9FUNG|nr:hypothetical protein GGI18_000400 [Coemansia linderi]
MPPRLLLLPGYQTLRALLSFNSPHSLYSSKNAQRRAYCCAHQSLSQTPDSLSPPNDVKAALAQYAENTTAHWRPVGDAIAQTIETLVKARRRSLAVRALRQVMSADQGLEEGRRLGLRLVRALNGAAVEPAGLAWLYTRCLGSRWAAGEALVAEMMAGLYAQHQYYGVIGVAQRVGPENVGAGAVRVALAAISKQQKMAKSRGALGFRGVARFMEEYRGDGCPFRQLARRLVDLLGRRDPRLVSAQLLAKLLEIELLPVPTSAKLPRQVHPWLDAYFRYGVEPTVHAFTILMHAYLRCGDPEFALWIYQSMQRGSVTFVQEGRAESMRVPAPNDVALATVALVWCQRRQWAQIHGVLERLGEGGLVSQRLVTRAVSAMVDDGHVREAEDLWLKYGCTPGPNALSTRVVNDRALAKLVLGCTRAKEVVKATGYFRTCCEFASLSETPKTHLTGLFNAVLRCALDNAPGLVDLESLDTGDGRPDLDILRIARLHCVRFDGDTYSVLISHLSRVAHTHELDAVAGAMQNLYTRLCSEGIVLDDMMVCHLVPVWVYLDLGQLVTMYWRVHTQGRPQRKVAQFRRHIMYRAEDWGVKDRVTKLLS